MQYDGFKERKWVRRSKCVDHYSIIFVGKQDSWKYACDPCVILNFKCKHVIEVMSDFDAYQSSTDVPEN